MTSGPVTIVGTTRWGTTLAVLLARFGRPVRLWARSATEAATLEREGEHRLRLPGIPFPPGLEVTADLERALAGSRLCCFVVPSQTMRENARRLRSALGPKTPVLSASKGFEEGGGQRMSEVLQDELGLSPERVAALSGPNLSREIAQGMPAAAVVACPDGALAQELQALLMGPTFRVYTSTDLVGVEMAGALKNVVALAAGMGDALGYGSNARAALLTRGLAEMSRLGLAYGAQALTFSGLAGLGDLIVTCHSPLSRNWQVGHRLGQGWRLEEALAAAEGIAEGVPTTKVAVMLARRVGVEMPIAEQVYRVLFEGEDPHQAVEALMLRAPKGELAGIEEERRDP